MSNNNDNIFLNKINKVQKGKAAANPGEPNYESFTKAMESMVAGRKNKIRSGTFPVHVSTAVNYCGRQHYLMEKAGREFDRKTFRADEVLWAMGKAIEKLNRDTLIEAYGTHNCYGIWTCLCKRTTMTGLGRNPFHTKCQHCLTEVTHTYNEFPIEYKGLMIGNPDLLIMKNGKLHVIEIKSINPEDFKKLVSPTANYKMQAYSYVRLLEYHKAAFKAEGIELDLKRFTVLYTNKGYVFYGSVDKEFTIDISKLPETFKQEFNANMYEIARVKSALELPKRVNCETVKCPQAKDCPVVSECFSYS